MGGWKAVAAIVLLGLGAAAWFVLGGGGAAMPPATGPGPAAGGVKDAPEKAGLPVDPAKAARPMGAGVVSGLLVRSRTNAPVPGAVRVTAASGASVSASAGANGWFRVEGLPFETDLALEATSPGLLPYRDSRIRIRPGEVVDLGRLPLSPPIPFEVHVVDSDGRPVPGAHLTLLRSPGWRAEGGVFGRFHVEADRTADAEGRALFDETGAGWWTLEAAAEGRARAVAYVQLVEGVVQEPRTLVLGPAGALRGRVLLGERSAPGAEVAVLLSNQGWDNAMARRGLGAADGEGRYRIDGLAAGPYTLVVRTLGGVIENAGSVQVAGETERDIVLPARSELRGRVLDAVSGTGVAGATVEARLSAVEVEGNSFDGTGVVRTDAAGAFSIPGLPATHVESVSVRAEGYLSEPGGGGALEPVPGALEPGRIQEVVIRIVRGVPVRGLVRDPAGKPVSYAWIDLTVLRGGAPDKAYEIPNVQSDGEGRYRIPAAPPGKGCFRAGAHNLHLPGMNMNAAASLAVGTVPPANFVEVPESGEAVKDLDLVPDCRVEGKFLLRDGRPAPGLVPVLYRAKQEGWEENSGPPSTEDGSFLLDDMAPESAEYYVAARGSSGEFGRSAPFSLDESQVVEGLAITVVGPGAVEGRVRRADGKPLAGATVRAVPGEPGEDHSWRWRMNGQGEPQRPVAADGTFKAEGLSPGKWTAVAAAPGCIEAAGPTVEVAESERKGGVEIVLEAEKFLSGRVTDAAGSAVQGARVTARRFTRTEGAEAEDEGTVEATGSYVVVRNGAMVYNSGGAEASTGVTGPDGAFRVGGLAAGTHRVSADARGRAEAHVIAEAGAEGLVLALVTGLTIEGRVVEAATGKPIPGMAVQASGDLKGADWDNEDMRITSGADGGFVLRGLPEVELQITVGVRGGEEVWAQKSVRAVAAGTKGLVLALEKGLALGGRLVDAGGGPLDPRGLAIRILSLVPGNDWNMGTEVSPDGAFQFKGLAAGKYEIDAGGVNWSGDTSPYVRRAVEVEAGTVDVVVRLARGKSIAGRLVQPSGESAPVALWIRAASGHRTAHELEVGSDGSFESESLEEGVLHDVYAIVGTGQVASATGVLPGTKGLVLEPTAGGKISGRVLRPDGTPAPAGVSVFARSAGIDSRRVDTETAADGSFTLEQLLPGTYRVMAHGALANMAPVVPAQAIAVGTAGVEVRTQEGRVFTVRIREASGGVPDLNGARVKVSADDESEVIWLGVQEGVLLLPALPPCKVKVQPIRNGDGYREEDEGEGPGWFGPFEVPGPEATITLPAAAK